MTLGYGLGMLLLGSIVIVLAAFIILFVINKLEKYEEENDN
tara:strand:- start:513 stop:635 length:123 start_codon:yes stop_codon:yes gene_type:complete